MNVYTTDSVKWALYDIRRLDDVTYEKWFSLMSVAKRERVLRLQRAEDRKRTVAGEMLAREMIASHCGIPPEEIVMRTEDTGKPYAEGLPIHFSISHAGDYVACVLDSSPIGIDIEKIRPVDHAVIEWARTALALDCAGHPPVTENGSVSAPAVLRPFFNAWTHKEAAYKCGGNDCDILHPTLPSPLCDNYVLCIARSK